MITAARLLHLPEVRRDVVLGARLRSHFLLRHAGGELRQRHLLRLSVHLEHAEVRDDRRDAVDTGQRQVAFCSV